MVVVCKWNEMEWSMLNNLSVLSILPIYQGRGDAAIAHALPRLDLLGRSLAHEPFNYLPHPLTNLLVQVQIQYNTVPRLSPAAGCWPACTQYLPFYPS